MIRDYSKNYSGLNKAIKKLGIRIPDSMKSFSNLHKASIAKGALPNKTKELIALGIAITLRCDGCIGFHVHDRLQAGTSFDEIMETIGVAVMMAAAHQ